MASVRVTRGQPTFEEVAAIAVLLAERLRRPEPGPRRAEPAGGVWHPAAYRAPGDWAS
ncbi:acyl-CoA carboxylase epsilon subunit [Streptomyces beihaiensis]|uniref:Acyl-CoA carboxylase epsilon subunit n=1 Tax=Streptomyces beihaiensis TaxID=2984495 RepID=A0ABT3TSB4_9ACTN|nr:acyl-CoA carboxylase epsilon subunit [Streptomyces beihaiensis]MCX3059916.1 acyl-CoA carboxylase epsilon subunit [Streptomyces beihaiensis]